MTIKHFSEKSIKLGIILVWFIENERLTRVLTWFTELSNLWDLLSFDHDVDEVPSGNLLAFQVQWTHMFEETQERIYLSDELVHHHLSHSINVQLLSIIISVCKYHSRIIEWDRKCNYSERSYLHFHWFPPKISVTILHFHHMSQLLFYWMRTVISTAFIHSKC